MLIRVMFEDILLSTGTTYFRQIFLKITALSSRYPYVSEHLSMLQIWIGWREILFSKIIINSYNVFQKDATKIDSFLWERIEHLKNIHRQSRSYSVPISFLSSSLSGVATSSNGTCSISITAFSILTLLSTDLSFSSSVGNDSRQQTLQPEYSSYGHATNSQIFLLEIPGDNHPYHQY